MGVTDSTAPAVSNTDQWAAGSAENRADTIRSVAAALFRERGYDAVSIRDLGSALGMSSSTLYHYFQNKQEILYAITERFMADFNRELLPLATGPSSARERLRVMVGAHLRFVYERRNDLLISTHFRNVLDDTQRARIVALMREYRHAVRLVIDEGIRDGSFDIVDADITSRIVLDLLQAEREWFQERQKWTIDQLADAYADAVLRICNDSGRAAMPIDAVSIDAVSVVPAPAAPADPVSARPKVGMRLRSKRSS